MGLRLPEHIATAVDAGTVNRAEGLWQAVTEALEGPGQEFVALEWLRQLAELNHPHIAVTVITGPRGE